jgi:hypothetical protein
MAHILLWDHWLLYVAAILVARVWSRIEDTVLLFTVSFTPVCMNLLARLFTPFMEIMTIIHSQCMYLVDAEIHPKDLLRLSGTCKH